MSVKEKGRVHLQVSASVRIKHLCKNTWKINNTKCLWEEELGGWWHRNPSLATSSLCEPIQNRLFLVKKLENPSLNTYGTVPTIGGGVWGERQADRWRATEMQAGRQAGGAWREEQGRARERETEGSKQRGQLVGLCVVGLGQIHSFAISPINRVLLLQYENNLFNKTTTFTSNSYAITISMYRLTMWTSKTGPWSYWDSMRGWGRSWNKWRWWRGSQSPTGGAGSMQIP